MGEAKQSKKSGDGAKFNPLQVVMREINLAKQRKCKSVRIGPTQMRLHEGEPDEIDSLVRALVERGFGVSVHVGDDYPSPQLRVYWKTQG